MRLALEAQRRPAVTGMEGMVNEPAEAITAIEPGVAGRVKMRGEIWQAVATDRIVPGDRVRVTNLDGLTVTVRKE